MTMIAQGSSKMKISRTAAYGLHALMYMVRHITQLPATADTIAKAEGIAPESLAKVLQRLTRAGFIQSVRGARSGYVFVRPPEEITLLDLFETLDGRPLFDDCPLKHCECGGTPENCCLFARWISATRKIRELFEETTVVTAAWNHPVHPFDVPPKREDTGKFRIEEIASRSSVRHKESGTPVD